MVDKTYYEKNRERLLAKAKEYRLKNLDYYTEYNKTYYQKNKEKLKAKHKEYERKNREKIYKKYREEYYPKNYAKKTTNPDYTYKPSVEKIVLSEPEKELVPSIVIQTGFFSVSFE